MTDTRTQSWCPTCGQNERAMERIDELTERLELIDVLNNDVHKLIEQGKRKDKLIAELRETCLRMAEGIGFYADKQMDYKPVSGIESCNLKYCIDHGDIAREIQKETAEIVERLRGENE